MTKLGYMETNFYCLKFSRSLEQCVKQYLILILHCMEDIRGRIFFRLIEGEVRKIFQPNFTLHKQSKYISRGQAHWCPSVLCKLFLGLLNTSKQKICFGFSSRYRLLHDTVFTRSLQFRIQFGIVP